MASSEPLVQSERSGTDDIELTNEIAELDRLQIDFIIEEPFDREFAAIEADGFVEMLKDKVPGLTSIHTGENWRFGKGEKGMWIFFKGRRKILNFVAGAGLPLL